MFQSSRTREVDQTCLRYFGPGEANLLQVGKFLEMSESLVRHLELMRGAYQ